MLKTLTSFVIFCLTGPIYAVEDKAVMDSYQESTPTAPAQETIVGSYKPIDNTSADAIKAAKILAKSINDTTFLEVVLAEKQIVAGTNYKIVIKVLDNKNISRLYRGVIFAPLPSKEKTQPAWTVTSSEEVVI